MPKRGPKPRTARTARRGAPPARDRRWAVPEYFVDDEAIRAWEHVVALLAEAGNLERTDPTLVEAYAVNRSLMRTAHLAIVDEGLSVWGAKGGRTPNPAISALNAATMRVKSIIDALGLCPAASKYAAEKSNATTGEDDKWGDLLGVVG